MWGGGSVMLGFILRTNVRWVKWSLCVSKQQKKVEVKAEVLTWLKTTDSGFKQNAGIRNADCLFNARRFQFVII